MEKRWVSPVLSIGFCANSASTVNPFQTRNRYWFSPATIRNMWMGCSMRIFDYKRPVNYRTSTATVLCSNTSGTRSRPTGERQRACGSTRLTICRLRKPFSSTAHGTSAKASSKIHGSTNCDRLYCSIGWRNFGDTREIARDGFWPRSKVKRDDSADNFHQLNAAWLSLQPFINS